MGSCRPPAHSAPHGHRSQRCRPAFEEQTSFYVPGWRRGARGSGLSPTQGWQGGFSTRLPGQGRSDRAGPVVPGPDRSQCHSGGVSLGPGLVGSRVARSELVLQLRFPGPSGGPRFPGQAAVAAKRDLTAAPAQPTRTHLPEGATHRPEACGRVSVPSVGAQVCLPRKMAGVQAGSAGRARGPTVSFSPPRIVDPRFEKVAYFVFGDFNFRLDAKSVVEVGAPAPRGRPCRRVRPSSGSSFPLGVFKAKTPNEKMPRCQKGGRCRGRGAARGRPFYAPVPITSS